MGFINSLPVPCPYCKEAEGRALCANFKEVLETRNFIAFARKRHSLVTIA